MTGAMTRPVFPYLLIAALLSSGAGAAPVLAQADAVALHSEPALGRLRVFDDWAVACDNRLSCNAVSLLPDGAGTAYSVLVSIERDGGPAGLSRLRLTGANELRGKIDVLVDGKRLARLVAARDTAELAGDQALTLIRTLGSSYGFQIGQRKAVLGAPSLTGLPQALRYMDEQQGRVGSQGALAAVGDKPSDTAKPVPPPVTFPVETVGPPSTAPQTLTEAEQQDARRLAVCDGRLRDDYPIEVRGLDADHALVLLPCNVGADNVSNVPLVATGEPGSRTFQIARFDHMPGFSGEPGTPPLIVNAQWNPARGELSSFARGRSLGDCGTAETYRWDGTMFRLIEARSMPVCRGAWEWLVLWTAAPAKNAVRPSVSVLPVGAPDSASPSAQVPHP